MQYNVIPTQCNVMQIQYNTLRYGTVRYGMVQHSTVQYSTIQYNTIQYNTVQYSTVQYSTVQCSAVQCSAVQCSAVQCSAVQCTVCSAVQCSAVQYRTNLGGASVGATSRKVPHFSAPLTPGCIYLKCRGVIWRREKLPVVKFYRCALTLPIYELFSKC